MDIVVGILCLLAAGFCGLLAIASLRVAIDLFKNGPEEIARRRNPQNYRETLVGVWIDREGQLRTKTKRKYVGYPERD